MLAGYNEAIDKANEIGREDINKYGTIIKFFCMPEEDYPPEKKGSLT